MEQRTVVVTGGSKGIGAAIVRCFHERGWQVVFGARHDNGLAAQLGAGARFVTMDASREADHDLLVKSALESAGRLDAYVNCAGFSEWRPIGEIDAEFLDSMIAVNLKGYFWGCKSAARQLMAGGSIVNISSLAGKRGSANNSAYCATKFAVNGLTQALAKELGGRGIRVNAVCPVYVETEGLLEALVDQRSPSAGAEITPFLESFARGNAALGRIPRGVEVAALCYYLASEQASAITGQCINVDCGVMPQ